jgi:Tol biopolymer transport system component
MSKSLVSGKVTELHRFDSNTTVLSPAISSDGKSLLFGVSNNAVEVPVRWATMPIAGGLLKDLMIPVAASEVVAMKWAPDGKSIRYARNENGVGNIWSVRLDGSHQRKLTEFGADRIYDFDVSANDHLVVSRGSEAVDLVLLQNVK